MAEQKVEANLPTERYNFSFGYLAAGNDVEVKQMTINEALAYAIKLGPKCIGFTTPENGDYNKQQQVNFKNEKSSTVYKNKADDQWQSYLKPKYRVVDGYLGAGYNVEVKDMSINEAKGHALLLSRCTGFTFKDESDLDKKITVWFKQDITEVYKEDSSGSKWTVYLFQ